jgi:hypothetical protein
MLFSLFDIKQKKAFPPSLSFPQGKRGHLSPGLRVSRGGFYLD